MGAKPNIAKRMQQKKAKQNQARAKAKKLQASKLQTASIKKNEELKQLISKIQYSKIALFAPFHYYEKYIFTDELIDKYKNKSTFIDTLENNVEKANRKIVNPEKLVYIDRNPVTNNFIIAYDFEDPQVTKQMLDMALVAVYILIHLQKFVNGVNKEHLVDSDNFNVRFYDIDHDLNDDYRYAVRGIKTLPYNDSEDFQFKNYKELIPEFLRWRKTLFFISCKNVKDHSSVKIFSQNYEIIFNENPESTFVSSDINYLNHKIYLNLPADHFPGEICDHLVSLIPDVFYDYLMEIICIQLGQYFTKFLNIDVDNGVDFVLNESRTSGICSIPVFFDRESLTLQFSKDIIFLEANEVVRFAKQAIFESCARQDLNNFFKLLDEEIQTNINDLSNSKDQLTRNAAYNAIYDAAEMLYFLDIEGTFNFTKENLAQYPSIVKALYLQG